MRHKRSGQTRNWKSAVPSARSRIRKASKKAMKTRYTYILSITASINQHSSFTSATCNHVSSLSHHSFETSHSTTVSIFNSLSSGIPLNLRIKTYSLFGSVKSSFLSHLERRRRHFRRRHRCSPLNRTHLALQTPRKKKKHAHSVFMCHCSLPTKADRNFCG